MYTKYSTIWSNQIDGLLQDCSNAIANSLELLQSCIKPSKIKSNETKICTECYINVYMVFLRLFSYHD